jgi:hypothetical protein
MAIAARIGNTTRKDKSMNKGYPRKPDRLTNPQDFGVMRKMAQFYSLQPLDEVVTQMESKWGENAGAIIPH